MGSFCTNATKAVALLDLPVDGRSNSFAMVPSRHVTVTVDLSRVRENAHAIRKQTGVPLIAVIKSDAYGLGAAQIGPAISEIVDRFCVFSLGDAVELGLWNLTGRESIAIGPPDPKSSADDYLAARVRPAVSTPEQAARLARAQPVLMVDTGMQRFACPAEHVDDALRAGNIDEAMTHATSIEQVQVFKELVGGRGLKLHAAGSSLLHLPEARLGAVRPGIALYLGAVQVTTRLIEVHDTRGPAGYSRFNSSTGRHGVILAGYSNGFRKGPCEINGHRRPVVETGMQSAFVELGPDDQVGDTVTLLGRGISEQDIATTWVTSLHEVMVRLTGLGERHHAG